MAPCPSIPISCCPAAAGCRAVSPGNEGICLPAAALNWGWQKGPCGRGARGATAWGRAQQALCKAQGGQYQPFTQNATSVRLCPESAGIAGMRTGQLAPARSACALTLCMTRMSFGDNWHSSSLCSIILLTPRLPCRAAGLGGGCCSSAAAPCSSSSGCGADPSAAATGIILQAQRQHC